MISALVAVVSLIVAQDDREAEMFGAPTSTVASSTVSRDAEIFGAEPERPKEPEAATPAPATEGETFDAEGMERAPGESTLSERLGENENPLAIGGLLWLRLDYSAIDDDYPETFPLNAPSFADAYFDARPNDRVRAYLRGRLRYDPTVREGEVSAFGTTEEQVRVQLDQVWVKLDIERILFVTLGKERVKWGTGRFWNPTDFLNQETLDPLAGVTLFDERLGVPLVKLHLPLESLGWNFYAVGTFEGAKAPENVGGALRAEILVAQTEFSLSVAGKKDNPARFGASVSSGIGPFDLRGEIALQHGNRSLFLRGQCSPNAAIDRFERGDFTLAELQDPNEIAELGAAFSRRDDWIPQAVLGAELGVAYGDDDSIYFGGEYFYNPAGYDDRDLYPCLAARGAFTPFYLGKHYAGAYVFLPSPGRWDDTTFVLSSIANLSDRSDVTRFDVRVKVLTYLDLNAFANVHFGAKGSEFRFAVSTRPLDVNRFLSQLPADPAIRAEAERGLQDPRVRPLVSGLELAAPLFEVGAGASLSF
jgi:hypothetical protein